MRNHSKLVLTALTAALVLAAAVSTASARRLQLSSQNITAKWTALTFSSEGGGEGIEAICPVTLEGSFHSRTISKVSGQLVGYITRANLTSASCTFRGGATHVQILNGTEGTTTSLPWHIQYNSFTGVLPRITGVRLALIGAAFLIRAILGVSCLYKSTQREPAFGTVEVNETTGAVTGLRADETRTIPLGVGGFGCPGSGFFLGRAAVTQTENAATITIRLVQ